MTTSPLQPDTPVEGFWIVDAEPAFALGAILQFPTGELKVFQLVWSSEIDGLDPDRDQKVYARGSTILNDPYGAP